MPTVAPSHSMHVVVSSPSMAIAEPDHFAKVISTSVYLRLNNPIRHRLYRAQPKFPHHRPIHMNLGRTPSETEFEGIFWCLRLLLVLADLGVSLEFFNSMLELSVLFHGEAIVSDRSRYVIGLEARVRFLGCHLVSNTKI
ncbi:hypothetical protein V6N11_082176 [Hibiscus sabdariffa]|uniref:Uncharacterized protein n=1 Tax=Hibiscus sabdariffa TaxID=183260 RepID=A0ABR2QH72_9ROSI